MHVRIIDSCCDCSLFFFSPSLSTPQTLTPLSLSRQDLVEVFSDGSWRAGCIQSLRSDGHLLRHIKVQYNRDRSRSEIDYVLVHSGIYGFILQYSWCRYRRLVVSHCDQLDGLRVYVLITLQRVRVGEIALE
jgi:hypothetical protein